MNRLSSLPRRTINDFRYHRLCIVESERTCSWLNRGTGSRDAVDSAEGHLDGRKDVRKLHDSIYRNVVGLIGLYFLSAGESAAVYFQKWWADICELYADQFLKCRKTEV